MGTGSLSDVELNFLIQEVENVRGDFAEIGVFRGATLRRLAVHAFLQKRLVHGFDSFVGMNTPGPSDGEFYPKGKFDVGGIEGFVHDYFSDVPTDLYRLWKGYVPDCFAPFPQETRFALAYVDLDHYAPTVFAIQWVWPRLNPGGILILDDYTPQAEQLASRANDEFLTDLENNPGRGEIRLNDNDQVMIKKK